MGQVCAKNDAGKVTTEAPPTRLKKQDKSLQSTQGPLPTSETKFVSAEINFNVDKGVDKKAEDLAKETAENWCNVNQEWEYTGVWNNVRNDELDKEVSQFEVRKKVVAEAAKTDDQPAVEETTQAAATAEADKDEAKVDKKQSFVDEVAAGLAQKVPADRFTIEEEEKNAETAAATEDPSKEPTQVEASEPKKEEDDEAAAAAADAPKDEAAEEEAEKEGGESKMRSDIVAKVKGMVEEAKKDSDDGEAAKVEDDPKDDKAADVDAKAADPTDSHDVAAGLGADDE